MFEPNMQVQSYQGFGFQKGGVFGSDPQTVHLDRPQSGFYAGAVYGTPIAPPQPGASNGFGTGGMSGGAVFGSR